jgi:hypothetical protein
MPRIPIWIAGVWPGTRPFRRAARWDGIFPIGRYGDMTPPQVREMIAYIERHRTNQDAFDVVISGRMHEKPAQEAAEALPQYASAGATWWLEAFWPSEALAYVESVIQRGPPHP